MNVDLLKEHNLIKLMHDEVYSNTNLKKLVLELEKINNKKLSRVEIGNFVNYIKNYNITKLYKNFYDTTKKEVDIDKLNTHFINSYMNDIELSKSKFDIHEFLKKEINGNAKGNNLDYTFSTNSLTNSNPSEVAPVNDNYQSNASPFLSTRDEKIELAKILNWQSLWRDSNVLIDSRYQNIANIDRSRIVFNIVANTKLKQPGSGVITSISNMRDIVEIEIYPFSIPYIASADNYYQKITLSILELSAISIDTYEDSQFHFIFQSKINGNLIDLIPINKTFRFFKPVTRINEFSLRFGSPLSPIIFDKDRLSTIFIDYDTNPAILTFGESHNLITGDLIYIENFNTLSPATDLNIIEAVNNSQGHICTRVNNVSFSINVDLTQINSINRIPNLSLLVYFGSKRIIMPIKFRYLIGKDE